MSLRRQANKSSVGLSKNESTDAQLLDLGIYVQDYEMHIAKQLSEILPILKSMPRIASTLFEAGSPEKDQPTPVLAAS
jgi:hypothetical protein